MGASFMTLALDGGGQLHTQKKSSLYPLGRRLSGSQDWSGWWGVEKYILFLLGIEPQPSSQLSITIPMELYTLQFSTACTWSFQFAVSAPVFF
jgi:hypothetical protein